MGKIAFYIFIVAYTITLFSLAIILPIGPNEALLYYTDQTFLYALTHLFQGWFDNPLAFRLPFVLFGLVNLSLFFMMSQLYFTEKKESYLATFIFALLPGIITSAVLVNIAVLVITFVLSFIIFYEKRMYFYQGFTMLALLLVHEASIIFFISLAIFSAFRRNQLLFTMSILLSAISLLYFNRLHIGGRPQGEFLELFGLYIALFSPLVFIYFFYALYRIWLREKKDILWHIASTSFIFSVLLSLRQQVSMTDFAPYVIVAVVLMLVIYHQTLHVRLPQFQKWYKRGFYIILTSLILSSSVLVFHKYFFYALEDKTQHFAYPFYEPYWQAMELKEIGQDCYTTQSLKVQYQFQYHGIKECQQADVPKIHK